MTWAGRGALTRGDRGSEEGEMGERRGFLGTRTEMVGERGWGV